MTPLTRPLTLSVRSASRGAVAPPKPVALHRGAAPAPAAVLRYRLVQTLRRNGSRARRAADDAGMATAEYAIATLAACGFAGLLVAILSGGQVRGLLLGIIRRALSVG